MKQPALADKMKRVDHKIKTLTSSSSLKQQTFNFTCSLYTLGESSYIIFFSFDFLHFETAIKSRSSFTFVLFVFIE